MALLSPSEYDVNYFDGYLNPSNQHPAGCRRYEKWYRISGDIVPVTGSTGEFYSDLAAYYNSNGFLQGKKVLELGCAKGYVIEALRNLGIDAWGMDVSAYAISQASPSIQSYLINADAVSELANRQENEFDVIISRQFLSSLSDDNLAVIIPLMNKVGGFQIHHIMTVGNPIYYNIKTMQQAIALPFKSGTKLIENDNVINPYTV